MIDGKWWIENLAGATIDQRGHEAGCATAPLDDDHVSRKVRPGLIPRHSVIVNTPALLHSFPDSSAISALRGCNYIGRGRLSSEDFRSRIVLESGPRLRLRLA